MQLRWSVVALCLVTACAPADSSSDEQAAGTYTEADFETVAKFDAHVHANVDDTAFLDLARENGFELLSINVDYPDFPPLARQAGIARKLHKADPGRFYYSTAFTMRGFGTPGWSDRTIAGLNADFADGAIAVKVWKNIGMVERDAQGLRVFLDDPRFEPVIERIRQAGVPLIAHQGEPRNCWLPLDKMTTANDSSYFRDHPEYYMYLHPEEPTYEMLMAARDRFVAFHPKLSVVGAHLASLEWNVDRVAEFLDRFPNATVDMAARMSELQNQSVHDYERVRRFMIKYQDRLIYGTDLTHNPPDPSARAQNPPSSGDDFAKEANDTWRSDWRYLATPLSQHVDAIDAEVKGLALPKAVIDQIYRRNAHRVFLHES